MIKSLQKGNKILCTSRHYREAAQLAKLRKMDVEFVGRHGGKDVAEKLDASLERMVQLAKLVRRFGPDLTVSFCSPEASRISYGLGVRHIAFCDSPHAEAVMRLCVPLVQKLLIPWIIPKKEFAKFGISQKDIIQYRAIDAAVIVKNAAPKKGSVKGNRRNILIRIEEEHAAYARGRKSGILDIIGKIADAFPDESVSVLPRYESQIASLRKRFGQRVRVLDRVVLGSALLREADVFVGSGGTMTAEAALSGIPTISYNAVPNLVQDYLVRKKLVILQSRPDKIVSTIERLLRSDNRSIRKNAKNTLASMEDPLQKLVRVIRTR